MKKLIVNGIFSLVALAVGLSVAGGALAAQPPPPGLTISPAFQQVSIAEGESSHEVDFNLTNNLQSVQTYDITTQDFNTLGESGGLFFVGTNPTQLQKKYGLAKWISLPSTTVTLQPKQSTTVKAQILNLPDMSPGGHYGAVMFSQHNQSPGPSKNSVSLHPIASSLLFVTKIGGDTHRLELASAATEHSLFKLPSSVDIRFYNPGNTHVIPRGVVTLTNGQGKVIRKGIINESSNIILPETHRQFYVPLDKVASAASFGKYHLKIDFRFDGIDIYRSYQSSYDYVPLKVLGLLLLVILVVTAALFGLKKYRRKN